VWEEQERERERIERAAARKAREAKLVVNPWFADGEDFTRKSSRLSTTTRPSYADADDVSGYCVKLVVKFAHASDENLRIGGGHRIAE